MKKLLALLLSFLLIISSFGIVTLAEEDNVAKVGNTEYATIDEAIAAWTNGTTLTLLNDVTLSNVIELNSTEHHILDLGTYTMSAASGERAFVIKACGTGSAERSTLTINADTTNPGGINAGNKSVIYYKYADGGISTEDRPIIKINNGVFTGATSSLGTYGIQTIGTAARKCATLNISGGIFNCSIYGQNKSKLIISGGTFNYSVGSQGDSTCLRLISGGTFKSFGFMTADSNNTKFWIGTSMGNSNVGAYVDDNGYLVVGGPIITEPDDKFEASSTYLTGWSSYLQYSSAKDNGLYYTSVEEALADNNKSSGNVTVYVDELDMSAYTTYAGTIIAPEGKTLTIKNAPEGLKTEGDVIIVKPVAKIGDVTFDTLQAAIDVANEGDTVVLLSNIEITSTVKVTADKKLTLDLNGFVIDGTENVKIALMSYGDVTLKDSSAEQTGVIKAGIGTAGNAVNVTGGTFTMESGSIYSKNNALLIDENASTVNIKDGKITAEPTTNNSAVMYISGTNANVINITGGEMVGYNGILLWDNTEINISDGTIDAQGRLGIQGNGSRDNTKINISGGSVSGLEAAIYHPQGGELNISGDATLTGATGIIVKGGTINISGGTISATGEAVDYTPVSSGFNGTGDALYVEHYDNSTSSENYGTPVVTVTGGTFNSANGKAVGSYANTNNNVEALSEFITGGTFSSDVSALCAESFTCEANEDGTYSIIAAPSGSNSPAYTKEVDGYVRVWGEGGGNAKESFILKLYSGDTLIATTKLNNVGGIINGDVYVTWNFYYPESNDEYWTTTWEEGHPNSAAQPTKVELWIDGTCVATTAAKMSGADDLNPVEWKDLGGVKYIVTGLQGSGTEDEPFLINNKEELIWLQEKVDEQAADGSTQFAGVYFKLTTDIDLAGINWNPIGSMTGDHGSFKGIFDGDGHTISNLYIEQAGNGLGLFARTAGNAVIKNLNLVNVTVKSTNNSNYLGAVAGNAYASTKIENVHVSGDVLISGRGYIGGIAGHGYVVMDNVSVIANEGSLITSTFWCAGGILGYGGEGATNIKNAYVEGITVTSAAGGLGAIVGMAEDNNGTQPISGSNLSAKDVEIKTYVGAYGTVYEDYAMGYLYGGNPTSILTGTLAVENVSVTTASGNPASVNDAVASANGVIYFELQSAVNAGGNVVILRDVALDSALTIAKDTTVTIDLAGYDITYVSDVMGEAMITNRGTLTINDSSEAADSKISYKYIGTADSSYGKGNYTISNAGTLTVNAGAIENITDAMSHASYAIDNNSINSPATLVVKGGSVTNLNNYAIRQITGKNANNITINDGYVSGTRAIWIHLPDSDSTVTPDVNLTVNGGTLNATGESASYKLAIYSYSYGMDMGDVDIVITDGTVNGDVSLTGGANKTNIESLTITGGTFTGMYGEVYSYGDDEAAQAAISITGGTFATNDAAYYAADDGYEFVENEDGTFSVTEIEEEKLNTRLYYVKGFKPAGSEETRYGFLMTIGIDSLDYKNDGCGFYLTVGDVTKKFIIENGVVWENFTVKLPDETVYITPEQFGEGNEYIMNYTVYFTDAELATLGNMEVYAQGFVTTFDGIEIKTDLFKCGKLVD